MKQRKFSLPVAAIALAALTGCSQPSVLDLQAKLEHWRQRFTAASRDETQTNKAQSRMSAALKQYEEGEYVEAAASLHAALSLGLPTREQVEAHKHLALIYCAADLEPACRSEFRKALIADPAMELDAAEAGHPKWGPVFQQVRAGG